MPQGAAWLGVFFVLWLSASSADAQRGGVAERIAAHVDATTAEWVAVRRDLHQNPEVSGQEVRTAKVVADHLRKLGLEVRTGVGGHGVVGILTGGRPGPLVAYRADMDAVRSTAPDPVAFPSLVPGVRHICGHDVHVTIGLGLASALASVKADLPGRVMFIFQPAEERATGARAMLDAGLFSAGRPEAVAAARALMRALPMKVDSVSSGSGRPRSAAETQDTFSCLLYTSDAADERSSVDLGGRRIIKKKNTHQTVHVRRVEHDKQ